MSRKCGKIKAGTVYLVLIFAIVEELWLEYLTIGSDPRYGFYIGFLPTTAGCLFLLYYRWHFLVQSCTELKGVLARILLILFYSLQGILFSYLTFGVWAKTGWNYINKIVADRNPAELIECPVVVFQQGKNSYIYYLFQNKKAKLLVRNKVIAPYETEAPGQYVLRFTARKGFWNYYLVDSWAIGNAVP